MKRLSHPHVVVVVEETEIMKRLDHPHVVVVVV